MTEKHMVVQIIGEPKKEYLKVDGKVLAEYYSVAAVLRNLEKIEKDFPTLLTFETIEKALNVNVGDIFNR